VINISDLQQFKCPCCGGAIGFDSKEQKMKCPYCNTEFDLDTLKGYDQDISNVKPDEMKWQTDAGTQWQSGETDSMNEYVCQSCGGSIVADKNTGATTCPFCGNPVVVKGQFSGNLKPDCVIPFKLDKKAAKDGLMKHLSGKKLLPAIFKNQNHIDEIKGVYVPFWLFNADADADIVYKATRERTWSDQDYNYLETSYYSVFREGSVGFDHVPVDGSTLISEELMESIEPFDYTQSVPFQTAYLAGYLADKYDVSAEQSVQRANDRVKQSTEDAFASTVEGYKTVLPVNTCIRLNNSETKYALYPVWLLNTTWQNKKYTFAMNGQTGKFVGDLPVDRSAFWKLFAIIGSVSAVAAYLIAYLINLL
jgi:DNA-directed RNA polymerase subunit RPC12/RpoP